MMKKYSAVFRVSLMEQIAYRTNFILWRVRSLISILITYYLWQSVYLQTKFISGYDRERMTTYILMIIVISGITQSTKTHKIGSDINRGRLSMHLLRPISYFRMNMFSDLSDKFLNIIFSLCEMALLVSILNAPLVLTQNPVQIILFCISVIIGSILYFEINVIISLVGFWSVDTWGPRFVFYILVTFLSGAYFPLDIFHNRLYDILTVLPFTYLVFFPIKVLMGIGNTGFIFRGLVISSVWCAVLYCLLVAVWKKGLKSYSGYGA